MIHETFDLARRSPLVFLLLAITACGHDGVTGVDASTTADATVPPDVASLRSGTLDPSFGVGGLVETSFGLGLLQPSSATSVVVHSDKSIVVGGWYDTGGIAAFGDVTEPAVAQYGSDGRLDPAFAYGEGALVIESGGTGWAANSLAVGADRSIVFAGTRLAGIAGSTTTFTSSATVARLTDAGALDPGFASAGVLATPPAFAPANNADVVAVDPGGVLFGGSETAVIGVDPDLTFVGNFALWRSDVSGGLDATFGTGGKTVVSGPPGSTYSSIAAIVRQSTGAIVALGTSLPSGHNEVMRFTADGLLDASFASGGILSLPAGYAMAIAPDDTIETLSYIDNASVLSRWHADGTIEDQITLPITINTLALQADGKLLGIGQNGSGNGALTTVVRYASNGALDPSFGTGGVFIGLPDTLGQALAVAPDGAIVVAGAITHYDGEIRNFAVWRLLP